MHVDEAGGGEFCGMVGEGRVEGALVMVVSICFRRIVAADVNHGVTCLQKGGIAGPEEGGGIIGWEKAEKVDC